MMSSSSLAAAVDSTNNVNAPGHQTSDVETLQRRSSGHSIVPAFGCSKRAHHQGHEQAITGTELLTHDDEEVKKRALPSEDSTSIGSDVDKKMEKQICPSSFIIDLTDVPPQPPILKSASQIKGGSSKYSGVAFNKSLNKWMALIMIDGKNRLIGAYDSEDEAAVDYARALHKYNGRLGQTRVTPEKPTMLSPSTVHLGSTPSLLSPPFIHSSNASDMVSATRKILKKPKRPLTAYHIYFQIEREFIIQTMADEDDDKSIHEGKIFFHGVPERYKATKLSPDWYFAPGKRAKRKHRKKHGKIGFHELSRVISSRWATLEETNPDVRQFVTKLANQVNEEYKRELKEYRENLTKNMIAPTVISKISGSMTQQPAPRTHQQVAGMMPWQQKMMELQQTHPSTSSFPFHVANQPNEDRFLKEPPVQPNQEVNHNQLQNEYAAAQR